MELFGNVVVWCIMASAVFGAICSIVNERSEYGIRFLEGFEAIGTIFIPVAGIMASAPYITAFVSKVFAPAFFAIGADPAMAATTFIAIDMGGYQLAEALAKTKEAWAMAMFAGYMAGPTIVFSIPVALKMLQSADRKYLALGMMSGFLAIPFGVLVSSLIVMASNPAIRDAVATVGVGNYVLHLGWMEMLCNIAPLAVVCFAIALGLLTIPNKMISGFIVFGKVMDSTLRIVLVCCIVEYFTKFFSTIFGGWGFDPIMADTVDVNRALEISGYVGVMLCGAFPMVALIKNYLSKPLNWVGSKFGLSVDATTGILAASTNIIALFAMVKNIAPEDKVKCLAYSVCAAFLIGDHLAFSANFQPTLILPMMTGKFAAGILAVWLATKIAVPRIKGAEAIDNPVKN